MDKYKVLISGKNPDYFLKKVISNKINIYDICKNYNELIIVVDKDGFKKLNKLKTSYKIEDANTTAIEICPTTEDYNK